MVDAIEPSHVDAATAMAYEFLKAPALGELVFDGRRYPIRNLTGAQFGVFKEIAARVADGSATIADCSPYTSLFLLLRTCDPPVELSEVGPFIEAHHVVAAAQEVLRQAVVVAFGAFDTAGSA